MKKMGVYGRICDIGSEVGQSTINPGMTQMVIDPANENLLWSQTAEIIQSFSFTQETEETWNVNQIYFPEQSDLNKRA